MDGVITTEEELEMEPNENITCGSANAHEAALFDKWEQYMKNKGYVVRQIGDSKENPTEKTATKGICNDKSETTIYDPAVEQEVLTRSGTKIEIAHLLNITLAMKILIVTSISFRWSR